MDSTFEMSKEDAQAKKSTKAVDDQADGHVIGMKGSIYDFQTITSAYRKASGDTKVYKDSGEAYDMCMNFFKRLPWMNNCFSSTERIKMVMKALSRMAVVRSVFTNCPCDFVRKSDEKVGLARAKYGSVINKETGPVLLAYILCSSMELFSDHLQRLNEAKCRVLDCLLMKFNEHFSDIKKAERVFEGLNKLLALY